MRQRSEIMPIENSLEVLSMQGSRSEDINMQICIELFLDIRQIAAASFVIANEGAHTLPTPQWLKDIATGE